MKPNTWTTASKSAGGLCVEVMEAEFTKSSFSNGNGGNNCVEIAMCSSKKSAAAGHCVEVGFAKAEKSGPNCDNCVEVSVATRHLESGCQCGTITVGGKIVQSAKAGDVLVRDSKDNGTGPILVFSPQQWDVLLADVRSQGMDWMDSLYITDGAPIYQISDPNGGDVVLRYTEAEWDAFMSGVNNGEFDRASEMVSL